MFIVCDECGKKLDSTAKVCSNCGCPVKQEKKHTVIWIIFIITLLLVFGNLCTFNIITAFILGLASVWICPEFIEKINRKSNMEVPIVLYVIVWFAFLIIALCCLPSSENPVISSSNTIQEDNKSEIIKKEDFINSCKSYDYKDIARNPNNYKNKNVTFVGEVIQVVEGSSGRVDCRIAVTEGTFGYYDDIIYCTYTYSNGESKILEDDIVTLYGICEGDYTYTSVLGGRITIPKVRIKYIELGDKSNEEEMSNKITLEKFNQIQTGMTYNDVVAIIGEEGELTSDVDLNMGSQYVTKSYDWNGKTGSASITFQGGKVSMKYQYGLK